MVGIYDKSISWHVDIMFFLKAMERGFFLRMFLVYQNNCGRKREGINLENLLIFWNKPFDSTERKTHKWTKKKTLQDPTGHTN